MQWRAANPDGKMVELLQSRNTLPPAELGLLGRQHRVQSLRLALALVLAWRVIRHVVRYWKLALIRRMQRVLPLVSLQVRCSQQGLPDLVKHMFLLK